MLCGGAFAGVGYGEPAGPVGCVRIRLGRSDIITLQLAASCGRGGGGGGLFVASVFLGSLGRRAS